MTDDTTDRVVPFKRPADVESPTDTASTSIGQFTINTLNADGILTISAPRKDRIENEESEDYIDSNRINSGMSAPKPTPAFLEVSKKEYLTLLGSVIGVGLAIAGIIMTHSIFVYQATTDVTREINARTSVEMQGMREEMKAGFQQINETISLKMGAMDDRMQSMETGFSLKLDSALAQEDSKREIQRLQLENEMLKKR